MERNMDVVWICLLGAGLVLDLPPAFSITTSKAVPRPPRLIGCVFLNRANVTCRWEPGDTPTMNYTLQVQMVSRAMASTMNSTPAPLNTPEFTCTTSGTSCTAITGSSVRFDFCITITAHGHDQDILSERRCQSGRTEVMLPPATLKSVQQVTGRPQCLNVTWSRILGDFPVSDPEIKAGNLTSQIEFTAQGQFDVQVKNVRVTAYSFLVCLFRPDTSYTIRLRHRYQGPESPWSLWSNPRQGRTGEDAPSAAPAFWRRVKQTDKNGWRLISLLWKPLPRFLARGRVLFFNVTCQTESAQVLNDHGSCRDLHHTSTSCSLLLPLGRCSCALTASTSAGTSPEARMWLLGASETEPPPPSQITANPLDDSGLNVRWTAPVDWLTSGFVVEWFAVREMNSSILHWERLNSSCTVLVITEGIKPMERYVVSVKALYGEQGAGQNRTVHIYTRQGAPSAGPQVEVQQIAGSTVELIWGPVPVELLHGFIRNYTLYYTAANQPTRRVFVPGHAHRYSLENLSPGNYDIFMQANTDAGAGAAGPIVNVNIGSEEISIVMCVLLPLMLTSLALVLMACLAQNKMVKQKLCQHVPDPSNSSLAYWTPKTISKSMKQPAMAEKTEIKYSEVILLGESELQNSDLHYESVCNLQTYSSPCYSPLTVSGIQTLQNSRKLEKCAKSSTKTTSNTGLSSCTSIYSNVLFSQTLKSLPTPLLSPSHHQFNDCQHSTVSVNDVKLQLGGGSELPVSLQGRSTTRSPLSQTDELKNFCLLLRQHQSPVSFSDFSSIYHSTVSLSHPAEVMSPQHPFSQSLNNSVPSLQPDTFTRTDALSDAFTKSSPFPHSVFVDFSYCPVECDPYISAAV
ncbi:interleukin-6 receptor subunit beta isoform X2 [Siniperca chuatsi]|uniref:interleukin-6 receptor subunit beta isoform X2 n=1 Tax=Siniperca chuatsi TaxID=119488 RepID=UPI001CE09CE8|nr:interleukin-6 receptor subunit beta isoform X2 [Siniperca chuatsi]XP_044023288.1 interleukin-6 receptor subunit beta isoform X2 [Siniperca chuatsi]